MLLLLNELGDTGSIGLDGVRPCYGLWEQYWAEPLLKVTAVHLSSAKHDLHITLAFETFRMLTRSVQPLPYQ